MSNATGRVQPREGRTHRISGRFSGRVSCSAYGHYMHSLSAYLSTHLSPSDVSPSVRPWGCWFSGWGPEFGFKFPSDPSPPPLDSIAFTTFIMFYGDNARPPYRSERKQLSFSACALRLGPALAPCALRPALAPCALRLRPAPSRLRPPSRDVGFG